MDNKTLATILFRVLGVSYFLYGLFYAPYLLFTGSYGGTFIVAGLGILTYFGPAIGLLLFSSPLAALVVKGVDRNRTSPPPPPSFNS